MSFLAWALVSLSPLIPVPFDLFFSLFLHLVGLLPRVGVELWRTSSLPLHEACVWPSWTEVRAQLTLVLDCGFLYVYPPVS